jgi:hypothetical protein
MGKRRGEFSDLMDMAFKLPWQVGVGLAVIVFLSLHWITAAFQAPQPAGESADTATLVIHQFIHVVASILQYVVPVGLLIGACASFFRRPPR